MSQFFLDRGYPLCVVTSAREKVFKTSRETLLYKKSSLNVSIVEFCLLLEKTIYNIYLMMLTLVKCLKTILLDLFVMKSLFLII